MLWQAILAAMLYLQPAGQSIYSLVPTVESAPRPCSDDYSLLCVPPRWSPAWHAWVTVETEQQGTQRYATIAKAIADVTEQEQWQTRPDWLWRYIATIAYHESGYRRDVHSGIGGASMGDCKWETIDGKRLRIKGSCKSYCLGQILLDRKRTKQGWRGRELCGVDQEATTRCITVVASYIDRCYQFCSKHGPSNTHSCVFAMYGGLSPAASDKRIKQRVNTFHKLFSAPPLLTDEQKELLH